MLQGHRILFFAFVCLLCSGSYVIAGKGGSNTSSDSESNDGDSAKTRLRQTPPSLVPQASLFHVGQDSLDQPEKKTCCVRRGVNALALWKKLALEVGEQQEQRTVFVPEPNDSQSSSSLNSGAENVETIHITGPGLNVILSRIVFYGWFKHIWQKLPKEYRDAIGFTPRDIKHSKSLELGDDIAAVFRPILEAFEFIEDEVERTRSTNVDRIEKRLPEITYLGRTKRSALNKLIKRGMMYLITLYDFEIAYSGGATIPLGMRQKYKEALQKKMKGLRKKLQKQITTLKKTAGAVVSGLGGIEGLTEGLKRKFNSADTTSATGESSGGTTIDNAIIMQIVMAILVVIYMGYLGYKYYITRKECKRFKVQQCFEEIDDDEDDSLVEVVIVDTAGID